MQNIMPMGQHVGHALSHNAINTASKMLKCSFRGWISSNTSFTFKGVNGVLGSGLNEEEGK